MKEIKIQTGLRIPESKHGQLLVIAERMGVSINDLILMLIDIGLNHLEYRQAGSDRYRTQNPEDTFG